MNIILTEEPRSEDIDFLTHAINQEVPKEYGQRILLPFSRAPKMAVLSPAAMAQ